MTDGDFKRLESLMAHQIGVMEENVQHKFDLVVEGQEMLVERMDRMEMELRGDIHKLDEGLTRVEVRLTQVDKRLERIETTVDRVAGDLSAHRADTEVHRGGYQVREE